MTITPFIPLLSRKQAADFLGISPRTMEKWAVVGGGPNFLKIGKKVMFSQQDILTWIDSRKYSHTNCNISTLKAS